MSGSRRTTIGFFVVSSAKCEVALVTASSSSLSKAAESEALTMSPGGMTYLGVFGFWCIGCIKNGELSKRECF